ncbi:MAG: protein-glutamate methylesterase/protein-glutamine glutaminase [Bacilli bacterium]
MKKIKVFVVDDSIFMQRFIKDMLQSEADIEVIGFARNGEEAIKSIATLKPDVVTLDVEMPIMDGLTALKEIMKTVPTPVIMLSSTTRIGEGNTIEAMQSGAVDFVAKPSGSVSIDLYKVKTELLHKVRMASNVNVQRVMVPTIKAPSIERVITPSRSTVFTGTNMKPIVAIGISTGGPKALQELFKQLPHSIGAPILIVQHMPKGFTHSLAQRLDMMSAFSVKEAVHGEKLRSDVAYIAPGGQHMTVTEDQGDAFISLNENSPVSGHRPSVDVLYTSLANCQNHRIVSCIMTGMGSDGTKGLEQLKQKSTHYSIGQSERTSVVYGMPKAPYIRGYIDEVCDLEMIAASLVDVCKK